MVAGLMFLGCNCQSSHKGTSHCAFCHTELSHRQHIHTSDMCSARTHNGTAPPCLQVLHLVAITALGSSIVDPSDCHRRIWIMAALQGIFTTLMVTMHPYRVPVVNALRFFSEVLVLLYLVLPLLNESMDKNTAELLDDLVFIVSIALQYAVIFKNAARAVLSWCRGSRKRWKCRRRFFFVKCGHLHSVPLVDSFHAAASSSSSDEKASDGPSDGGESDDGSHSIAPWPPGCSSSNGAMTDCLLATASGPVGRTSRSKGDGKTGRGSILPGLIVDRIDGGDGRQKVESGKFRKMGATYVEMQDLGRDPQHSWGKEGSL